MIGTQFTITNQDNVSIVLNDHTTDPTQIIALQTYPQFDIDVKNNEVNKEGQHGIWDFYSYFGRRIITFTGVIVGNDEDDVETVRKKLLEVLALPVQPTSARNGTVTIKWTDPNSNAWQIDAKMLRMPQFSRPLKQTYRLDFNFTLKASDPFIEGQTLNVENGTRGYEDAGGLIIPVTFPFSWSSLTKTNIETITNTGNASAHTIIRLNSETNGITNPRVYNLTTGKKFQVNTTIASGGYIEIDSKNGTVVDDAGNDLSGFVASDSEFIILQKGSNQIWYESDENPYNVLYLPSATFSVSYRNTQI